jgi:hypothetical protein
MKRNQKQDKERMRFEVIPSPSKSTDKKVVLLPTIEAQVHRLKRVKAKI